MRSILLTIEKKNLINRKEEFTVHISLSTTAGLVIEFPVNYSPEIKKCLESKLRPCISIYENEIKAKCISEETFVIDRICKDLRNRRINGSLVVTDTTVFVP
ncbi:MAG: hypothetical protein Q8N22_03605 [bacterium]|nr:hypothetical protein [bacterium]